MTTDSARRKFRSWRRGRPFWGGLILLLSALELFFSANLTLGNLQVHVGEQGYLSYVLPAVLVLCGLLTWASPGQRLFYGIMSVVTAVYSFLGLNLGGFGLGMILGIVGGALVIAWGPPRARPAGEQSPDVEDPAPATDLPPADQSPVDQSPAGQSPVDAEPGAGPRPAYADESSTAILPGFSDDGDGPRPPSSRGTHRKLLVITLVPLALTVSVLAGGGSTPARAEDCPKDLPSRSPTATADPSASALARNQAAKQTPAKTPAAGHTAGGGKTATTPPTSAPTPVPTTAPTTAAAGVDTGNPLVDGWNSFIEGVGKVLGVGDDETPGTSPTADPSTTPAPPPPPDPTSAPASGSASPGAPSASTPTSGAPTPSASASTKPSLEDVPCLGPRVFKSAKPGGVPPVSVRGGLLEGKSLNMFDSIYEGTVNLRTAKGPLKVLKFSMSKSVTEPFSLTIPESGGHTTLITSDKLTTQDNVKFYTPRFEGKLFGVFPVLFTPDSPPPLTLPWLWFSDVKINLAFISCDTLIAAPLRITEKS